MLIFSDLHLKPESAPVCLPILDCILEEAVYLGEKDIAFLGDFWHLRYNVPVGLLNAVSDWCWDLDKAGKRLFLLPGNHDQIDENGNNALDVFQAFEHVQVFTTPAVNEYGMWLPYRKPSFVPQCLDNLQALRADYAKLKSSHHVPNVLFAHVPIKGAYMNNNMKDETGLEMSSFTGIEAGLFGHYHRQQSFGSFHYVGSPWQTRADEWGQPKGFGIWDPVQKALTRHDRVWGPRFHKIEVTKGDLVFPGEIGPQDQVTLTGPLEQKEAVIQDLAATSALPATAKLIWNDTTEKAAQPRFGFAEGTTLTEYGAQYMEDCCPKTLNKKVLWALHDEIKKEAGL